MMTVVKQFTGATAEQALLHMTYLAGRAEVSDLVDPVLSHKDFATFPASVGFLKNGSRKHHYFEGGLAVHTAQVVSTAWYMADYFSMNGWQRTVLITAAIWHDFGKVDEYEKVGDLCWERRVPHLGHIAAGLVRWGRFARTKPAHRAMVCLPAANQLAPMKAVEAFDRAVSHLIASHHGLREWGSPDSPANLPAVLLHQADMLSLLQDGSNPYAR